MAFGREHRGFIRACMSKEHTFAGVSMYSLVGLADALGRHRNVESENG